MKLITDSRIFSIPRKLLGSLVVRALDTKNGIIVYYDTPERAEALRLIDNLSKRTKTLLTKDEKYQIYMAAKRSNKVPGDIAEVGVYKGGSAQIICEVKGEKNLYLFDTFEGLPEVEGIDQNYKKGDFSARYEKVKSLMSSYPNVHIYKGLFPDSAGPVKEKRFSFVNLDVDLYKSTKDCLDFFYPRMNKGGIILSHDYLLIPGVRKAFDEFFKDKPEPIIELTRSQCLVVKT